MVLSQLFLTFAVACLHFKTFILPLMIISDNQVRFLFAQGAICNCGNVSKMLQETYMQSYITVKSGRHLCKNAVK